MKDKEKTEELSPFTAVTSLESKPIGCKNGSRLSRAVVYTPLIPALRKRRQTDVCEFKASLPGLQELIPEQSGPLHRETLPKKKN